MNQIAFNTEINTQVMRKTVNTLKIQKVNDTFENCFH